MSSWKEKAIERRLNNKALLKRKKELLKSRDGWKDKCFMERHKIKSLENELAEVKKNLKAIIQV